MKIIDMTSVLVASCVLSAAMTACSVEASRVFRVGDAFGWRVPSKNDTAVYTRWATRNRFIVGDSLHFVYQNDSVMEVEKWGYYHCNGSESITAFDNGNSTINLDRPGPFYFISGAPGHCKMGQRLIVEVMHLHHRVSRSPPASASPPDSYALLAPSPLSTSPAPLSASCSWALLAFAAASAMMLC